MFLKVDFAVSQTDELPNQKFDLRTLHGRYSAWLKTRLVKRYGAQDAEDLVQETWLRLSSYWPATDIRYPRAFLLRVAANLAADRRARQTRKSEYLDHAGANGPDVSLPTQAEALLVKEVILSLPEPLRDVFLLSRLDGLTNAQIGERLGISPKTVEWRMTRALAHCAAQLRR